MGQKGNEGGFIDLVFFSIGLPFRPLFAMTMATTDWDSNVNIFLPVGMLAFIPWGNPIRNMYAEHTMVDLVAISFFWTIGIVFSMMTYLYVKATPQTYIAPLGFYATTFVTSLFWTGIFANETVGALECLGVIMKIEPSMMGMTLLAWGNSLDALVATIGLAKKGQFAIRSPVSTRGRSSTFSLAPAQIC